jgi:hypothetical protein
MSWCGDRGVDAFAVICHGTTLSAMSWHPLANQALSWDTIDFAPQVFLNDALGMHNGTLHIPPDLVVKYQSVDIIDVIRSLAW